MNDILSNEALSADLERLHQLSEITGTDALTISARETLTYRRALREALEKAHVELHEYRFGA